MSEHKKVDCSQLELGDEFPPSSRQIDSATVNTYLKAVEETSHLYQDSELVPPMAVAAYAMATLSENIAFPAGAIHVSQELEFIDIVSTGDTITSYAKVTRKQDRGKLHLLTIDLNVFNQSQKEVLAGKMSVILPESK
ncbi:MAG: MaoC family dehydratase [Dehalococcoidales bacterium]